MPLCFINSQFPCHPCYLPPWYFPGHCIWGLQFASQVWRAFCQALGVSVSLSIGYHPQTNGQTEWVNQDLESSLCCVASSLPASWSTHLLWAEYAHNSLVSYATSMSSFMMMNGFQPPLFPSQESNVAVSSFRVHLHCAHQVWRETRAALGRTAAHNQRLVD